MSEVKTQQKIKHDVILKSRKSMSIDGVEDVISFDESLVVLLTTCGEMTVEGSGLHIRVLDLESGVVELDGNVDGVFYSDEKNDNSAHKGVFARLFG